MRKNRSLFLALLFATLCLHLYFLFWAFTEIESREKEWKGQAALNKALATRVVSPAEFQAAQQRSRNVVDTQIQNETKNPKTKANYLGEKTQRVEKETVAQGFGSATGGKKGPRTDEDRVTSLEKLGLSGGLSSSLRQPPKAASGEGGDGQLRKGSMDLVDTNVAVGAQTLLNTDEYVYASFFNRMKAEIGPRWEPLIEMAINTKQKLSPGFYRTEVLFTLNDEGDVQDVQVKKASGFTLFDEAAVTSIRQVLRIKNPPMGLRATDGSYRVHLTFVVNIGGSGNFRVNYEGDPRYRP